MRLSNSLSLQYNLTMANAIYYEMQEPRSSVETLSEEPWSLSYLTKS